MKYAYGLVLFCSIILWSSCRNDFSTTETSGNLEFSRDTVFLDTIFTNIGSSTYNLKVYNNSDEDINIPNVRLGDGETSNYRLNVDGIPGKVFQDIQVLAKDSIFIFVETTLDIESFPNPDETFLYTDQILFEGGGTSQKVELVTLIQDAVFLFPELDDDGMVGTLNIGVDGNGDDVLIEGFILDDDELTFTNEKPYVIYGYAAVNAGKTLTVEAGARIHFHNNSGIIVANTGSMKVNGAPSTDPETLENEVIFEGDRLEPGFSEIPGQWGAIWLTAGSMDHEFKHTTIKNGTVGILMDSNDGAGNTLTLENVQIYNNANVGLLARTGVVRGDNVVINNSGQPALALSLGGTYVFNHCTFANYWNNSGFRTFPTVQMDNVLSGNFAPLDAQFNNCIIYGNQPRELGFIKSDMAAFDYNFTNCLIRFEDPNGDFANDPLYDFTNGSLYTNTVINSNPFFHNPENNNFNIELGTSGAEGIGLDGVTPLLDLNQTPRDNTPDVGAYEATEIEPEG